MFTETGKELGRGMYGRVVVVTDKYGRAFAKKVFDIGENRNANKKEARNELQFAKLLRHNGAHIAKLITVVENGTKPIELIYRLYEGSAYSLFPMKGEHEVISFARQLCAAVGYIAAAGYVHCDVKSSNILFERDFLCGGKTHYVLADFGMMLRIDSPLLPLLQPDIIRCAEAVVGNKTPRMSSDMPMVAYTLYTAITGKNIMTKTKDNEFIAELCEVIGKWSAERAKNVADVAATTKSYCGTLWVQNGNDVNKRLVDVFRRDKYTRGFEIMKFISRCLFPDPDGRLQPAAALSHALFANIQSARLRMSNQVYIGRRKVLASHKLQFHAIAAARNGMHIRDITRPHPRIYQIAVEQNGLALKHCIVPMITATLMMSAILQDPMALQYIDSQTTELQAAAIEGKAAAIQYCNPMIESMAQLALCHDPFTIEHIEDKFPDLRLFAVKLRGSALCNIKKPTYEMQLAAVTHTGLALRFIAVADRTAEICTAAIAQNPLAKRMTFT